ncbi:MAG: family 10 glycosylhydrolase [bacterium]|nr:family 10 glycosylhydrolase [bacterium]
MKKFLFSIFVVIFFILSFFMIEDKQITEKVINTNSETRGVFLSYMELGEYLKDKTETESKKNIIEILENLKKYNFNLLIVQVRAFSDAIYDSKIFPYADYVKNNGKNPNYDVLKYIIDEAHKRKIEVYSWINPYRVSTSDDLSTISKNNPAYNFIEDKNVSVIDGKGIYYNPACTEVQELIINGIKEIIENYEIDGIEFDDYFYPDDSIDKSSYKDYKSLGGTLSLKDYRYNIILSLIKNTYSEIKKLNKNVLFGISPEGNIDNNYNSHYLDVKTILSNSDYVDFIMPQIYFGFENTKRPFVDTLNSWSELIKDDSINLIPALAFYKVGTYDQYAGEGSFEWINNSDIISRQVKQIRNITNGFSLFRYDFLFSDKKRNNNTEYELNKLNELLK